MRYAISLLALVPVLAYAQIYQYIDPETGSKKLTNLPPPWYSPDIRKSGPHTVVILRGAVIDDTSEAANAAETQLAIEEEEMRFAEAEERRLAKMATIAAHATASRNRAAAQERVTAAKAAREARIYEASRAIRSTEALTGRRDYGARKRLEKMTGGKIDQLLPEYRPSSNQRTDVDAVQGAARTHQYLEQQRRAIIEVLR